MDSDAIHIRVPRYQKRAMRRYHPYEYPCWHDPSEDELTIHHTTLFDETCEVEEDNLPPVPPLHLELARAQENTDTDAEIPAGPLLPVANAGENHGAGARELDVNVDEIVEDQYRPYMRGLWLWRLLPDLVMMLVQAMEAASRAAERVVVVGGIPGRLAAVGQDPAGGGADA